MIHPDTPCGPPSTAHPLLRWVADACCWAPPFASELRKAFRTVR